MRKKTINRSIPNSRATVTEAVAAHRARAVESELKTAYRHDAEHAERLNREWLVVDAEAVE